MGDLGVQMPYGKGKFWGGRAPHCELAKYSEYRLCTAAMQPVVRLLWPLVLFLHFYLCRHVCLSRNPCTTTYSFEPELPLFWKPGNVREFCTGQGQVTAGKGQGICVVREICKVTRLVKRWTGIMPVMCKDTCSEHHNNIHLTCTLFVL